MSTNADPSTWSLHARTARAVRGRRALGVRLATGSVMHASGHALLAAAGGALARALAGGAAPMDRGSMAVLGTLGAGEPLLGLAILGTCAAVAKTLGATLAGGAEARVAGDVGSALRLDVLDRLLAGHRLRGARQRDHGASPTGAGAGLASLTTHVLEVERGVAQGVIGEVRALVQIVPLGALLVALAPRLAGTAVLALGGFALLALGARGALKRAHVRATAQAERLLGASDEAVRHADLWKTYGATARVRGHLRVLGDAIVGTQARLRAQAAVISGTSEILGALALALVLALAGRGALGGVDRATLVPFAVAFFMTYKPLRELVDARLARARGEAALVAALGAARDQEADGGESEGAGGEHAGERAAGDVHWPLGELVLEGVASAHGAHAPLSLRVPPGAVVALTGPTGVGKTSLLRVLLGLDRPRTGHVYYACTCLDASPPGPGRPFAWVPQDAPVIAASLAENVTLGGRADGRRDEGAAAAAALARVGAAPLARAVGDAILVTERHVSGGERQWIALARAVASEAPVLLLDEPTSALDPEAQAVVLAALARLRGERTVLLVTHRTEPIAIADHVVRLDEDQGAAPSSVAPAPAAAE